MPTAISYIRFSSKKQEEGDSVRRQRQMAAQWLDRNPEYTLSDITYEDLGLSASKGHHLNGNLGKILEAVESGAIAPGSVILVETLDRFSRLPAIQTLKMLEEVVSKGVDLITLSDGIRYNKDSINGAQLFMLAGAALGAYEYSQNLSKRISASYRGREETAKRGGTIKRRNPFWLTSAGGLKRGEAGGLALEVLVVQDVFKSFVEGVSIHEVARKHAKFFSNPASVRKVLYNPAAIGHWQLYEVTNTPDGKQKRKPGEVIKNVFEPAVDDVIWYQAQQMFKKQPDLVVARANPLAGIVVCAVCGGNMAKRNANAKNMTASMTCYTRGLNKESCTNSKTYPMPVLGAVFFETMRDHVAASIQKTKLSGIEQERVLLTGQINELSTKKQRLMILVEDGDEDALERVRVINSEVKELQAQHKTLPSEGGKAAVSLTDVYRVINGDPFTLTRTLQLGGYRIVCDAGGKMTVQDEQWEYLGYNRKAKTFLIKMPDGTVATHDSLLASNGTGSPEAHLELPPDPYANDDREEEHLDQPYVAWPA